MSNKQNTEDKFVFKTKVDELLDGHRDILSVAEEIHRAVFATALKAGMQLSTSGDHKKLANGNEVVVFTFNDESQLTCNKTTSQITCKKF